MHAPLAETLQAAQSHEEKIRISKTKAPKIHLFQLF